jgi:hypothetical protein
LFCVQFSPLISPLACFAKNRRDVELNIGIRNKASDTTINSTPVLFFKKNGRCGIKYRYPKPKFGCLYLIPPFACFRENRRKVELILISDTKRRISINNSTSRLFVAKQARGGIKYRFPTLSFGYLYLIPPLACFAKNRREVELNIDFRH